MGWIALAALALPYWMTIQERTAEQALRELGARFGWAESGGGLAVDFKPSNDATLIKAAPYLQRIRPRQLALDANNVTSLEALKHVTSLRTLNVSMALNITSLEPLEGLTNLSELILSRAPRIDTLEPLKGLTNLRKLIFDGAIFITSLEPLKGLIKLNDFVLIDYPRKPRFSEQDYIVIRRAIEDYARLSRLLRDDRIRFRMRPCYSLEPLEGLTRLSTLTLTCVASLEPLKGLTSLSKLVSHDCEGVTSLEPLNGLTNLSDLVLYGATAITSLEPLKGLTNLSSLDLSGAIGITNLEPLKELTKLSSLDLSGATGITTLEPLRGRGIGIKGASDELLATKR